MYLSLLYPHIRFNAHIKLKGGNKFERKLSETELSIYYIQYERRSSSETNKGADGKIEEGK